MPHKGIAKQPHTKHIDERVGIVRLHAQRGCTDKHRRERLRSHVQPLGARFHKEQPYDEPYGQRHLQPWLTARRLQQHGVPDTNDDIDCVGHEVGGPVARTHRQYSPLAQQYNADKQRQVIDIQRDEQQGHGKADIECDVRYLAQLRTAT